MKLTLATQVIPPVHGCSPVSQHGRANFKVLFKKRPKMATGKSSAILFMKAIIYDSNGDVAAQSLPFELVFKGGVNDCRFSEQSASTPMASLPSDPGAAAVIPQPPTQGKIVKTMGQDSKPQIPYPITMPWGHPSDVSPTSMYKPFPLPERKRSRSRMEVMLNSPFRNGFLTTAQRRIPSHTLLPKTSMGTLLTTRLEMK